MSNKSPDIGSHFTRRRRRSREAIFNRKHRPLRDREGREGKERTERKERGEGKRRDGILYSISRDWLALAQTPLFPLTSLRHAGCANDGISVSKRFPLFRFLRNDCKVHVMHFDCPCLPSEQNRCTSRRADERELVYPLISSFPARKKEDLPP